ncbi:hypothetical protein MY1884_001362 [Beauveria asiatica]|uniref:Uncharacterized protein n=1 Tax=Beauveria asiatica TaxID=1069075 RepID=A0AAW0S6Q5_9HYPO
MSFEDCHALVKNMVEQQYTGVDCTTIVYLGQSQEILKSSKVGLWAHSVSQESVVVNMRMPGIRRFLSRLADMGLNVAADYQGVRYKFVKTNLDSRTTSPSSSL